MGVQKRKETLYSVCGTPGWMAISICLYCHGPALSEDEEVRSLAVYGVNNFENWRLSQANLEQRLFMLWEKPHCISSSLSPFGCMNVCLPFQSKLVRVILGLSVGFKSTAYPGSYALQAGKQISFFFSFLSLIDILAFERLLRPYKVIIKRSIHLYK